MRTAELTGALLDYWVARAEGEEPQLFCHGGREAICIIFCREFTPSTSWAQGGPIIERERMRLNPVMKTQWTAEIPMSSGGGFYEIGPTPLVAAMRAYVASKFGDSVPDEPA